MTLDKTNKHRIFISSVQKELELERIMIASLITTDPFLDECLEPVLFDKEPVSGRKASKPYLKCLDTCNLYLLMINREYGQPHGPMSATHHEYRHAQKLGLPTSELLGMGLIKRVGKGRSTRYVAKAGERSDK